MAPTVKGISFESLNSPLRMLGSKASNLDSARCRRWSAGGRWCRPWSRGRTCSRNECCPDVCREFHSFWNNSKIEIELKKFVLTISVLFTTVIQYLPWKRERVRIEKESTYNCNLSFLLKKEMVHKTKDTTIHKELLGILILGLKLRRIWKSKI